MEKVEESVQGTLSEAWFARFEKDNMNVDKLSPGTMIRSS